MSKRLQVLLDAGEMERIRRIAEAQHVTVSEWVRRALREAERECPAADAGKKVQIVRDAARHSYPTGDMDGMLREIEQGYPGNGDT